MFRARFLSFVAVACIALAPLSALSQGIPRTADQIGLQAHPFGTWGYDLDGRDTGIRAGDDFFSFASGTVFRTMEIPPDRSRYGALDSLIILSENRTRNLVETVARSAQAAGSDRDKMARIYNGFMNQAAIERRGLAPIRGELDMLRQARTRSELAAVSARFQGAGGSTLFTMSVAVDSDARNRMALYLSQSGLIMPSRDYYLAAQFAPQRAAFLDYAETLFRAAGWNDSRARARDALAFETAVAEASYTAVQNRNERALYNPAALADMARLFPGYPWASFFRNAGIATTRRVIIVQQRDAIAALARLHGGASLETLRSWQALHLLHLAAPFLPSTFERSYWRFSNAYLGQSETPSRERRAYNLVDEIMGNAIGKLYVERYYDPGVEPVIQQMFEHIRASFRDRIRNASWLDTATKSEALLKLSRVRIQIGRPANWTDYRLLTVSGEPARDFLTSLVFRWRLRLSRLTRPPDEDAWDVEPQMAISSYSHERNAITIAAGQLYPPFFDPAADPAVNYGALGAVIGHELTHGFDDRGRQFDAGRQVHNWWSDADDHRFREAARQLIDQYDGYEILPGLHIRGAQTIGENIADLGGLTLALDAYDRFLQGRPAPVIDGYSGDQRLFFGWAQIWCTKVTDAGMRRWIATRPHSPGQFRVNGVVRNLDRWYSAFNVGPRDRLYLAPAQRVRIW